MIGSRLQVSTRKFNLLLPDGCEENAGGQEGVDQEGCNEGASQAGGNEEDASRESGNEEPRHEICEDAQEPMESDEGEEDASK